MNMISVILQILLGIGFLMFGVMKFAAKKMADQFAQWRLPAWFRPLTGLAEIAGSILMFSGIWNSAFAAWGGLWLCIVMAGAILTHIRIQDPLRVITIPTILFILSLLVLLLNLSYINTTITF